MKEQASSLFHIIDWYPWTKYQCLSFLRKRFVSTLPYCFCFNKNLFIHLFIHQIFTEHLLFPALCCAKSLQSCLTLCDPMDHSPPGSSVQGILQAGMLEWIAISHSRESSRLRDRTLISYTGRFFTTSITWESLNNGYEAVHKKTWMTLALLVYSLIEEIDTC